METKIRVLIADPNEDFQLLMKSLLSQVNIQSVLQMMNCE